MSKVFYVNAPSAEGIFSASSQIVSEEYKKGISIFRFVQKDDGDEASFAISKKNSAIELALQNLDALEYVCFSAGRVSNAKYINTLENGVAKLLSNGDWQVIKKAKIEYVLEKNIIEQPVSHSQSERKLESKPIQQPNIPSEISVKKKGNFNILIYGVIASVLLCVGIYFVTTEKADKIQSATEQQSYSQKNESLDLSFDKDFFNANIIDPDLAYIPVKDANGLYKYIYLSGRNITDAKYINAYMFSENRAMVRLQDSTYSFIDTSGKQVNCCYDLATSFKEGVAWTLNNGKNIKQIDLNGNSTELNSDIVAVWSYYEGYSLFAKNGEQSFMDKNFNTIGDGIFYADALRFQDELAGVMCDNGKYGFIDKQGEFAIDCEFDEVKGFKNGMAVFRIGKNWGAINKIGKKIFISDAIILISDGDMFRYQDKISKKWGWFNSRGKVIISPIYEETGPFVKNDVAPIKLDGLWGFINKQGVVQIEVQFKYAYPFYNERALAQFTDDTWGTIDINGNTKLKTNYTQLAGSYWNLAIAGSINGPKLMKRLNTGFDCRKANNKTEKTICYSVELSRLDSIITYKYNSLEDDYQKIEQKEFLKTRNDCKDNINCIREIYTRKINELE